MASAETHANSEPHRMIHAMKIWSNCLDINLTPFILFADRFCAHGLPADYFLEVYQVLDDSV